MKYSDTGVNIDAAGKALAGAKSAIRSTWNERVLSEVGSFGGLYRTAPGQPLLVASVDGVGTKVKIATMAGRFDTVGQDLVNHCVDDILVQGAEPLFFLDYFATGQLKDGMLEQVIEGFATACRENGCALLGGETAEMPGVYPGGEFDLAGCIVGQVKEDDLIDGSAIHPGDVLWGLPSSGLHTNGYSLARRIFFDVAGYDVSTHLDDLGGTVGDALLAVHRSYLEPVRTLWRELGRPAVHGLAYITGGGFYDNIPRIIPDGCCARVETTAWDVPAVFRLMAKIGDVAPSEMYRVFNMGLGLILAIDKDADRSVLQSLGAIEVGEIVASDEKVDVVLA